MIYLIVSILSSFGIFLAFKHAGINRLNSLALIVVNYIIASTVGVSVNIIEGNHFVAPSLPFSISAFLIGGFFIATFYLIEMSTRKQGVGVTSAATKLSFVWPVALSIAIDPFDHFTASKAWALGLMILSILLISLQKDQKYMFALLPIILFFGMGGVDSLVKYSQQFFVEDEYLAFFSTFVFMVASVWGLLFLTYQKNLRLLLNKRILLAGSFLGICNYGSLFFFIKTLNQNANGNEFLDSSRIIVLNNIGIILLSTLVGFLFYKEKISLLNLSGLLLSVIGIFLLI